MGQIAGAGGVPSPVPRGPVLGGICMTETTDDVLVADDTDDDALTPPALPDQRWDDLEQAAADDDLDPDEQGGDLHVAETADAP